MNLMSIKPHRFSVYVSNWSRKFRHSVFPFCFTHVIVIGKTKLRCLTMSPLNLHLICESFLLFNLPNIEHLGCLIRKLNQQRIICCHFLIFTCLGRL